MSQAKHAIRLEWKEFSIDLNTVEAWMRANAGDQYSGNQSQESHLELWFAEEPSSEEKADIAAYWAALDDESDEAANYVAMEDREADKAAKKASGKAKLAALGLSAEEIAALVG